MKGLTFMKKFYTSLALGALAAAVFSTAAYAAPLKNYDAGHAAIDAGFTLPADIDGDHYSLSKDNSAYWGATVGLGNKTALNYKWNSFDADEGNTKTQQVNLMYQLHPNISAYAGYLNIDNNFIGGDDKNAAQIGLQAQVDLPLMFTVWGNIGYGKDNTSYEIGISKPLLNNIDLNLSYYNHKFDDAFVGGDIKADGVNMGVTVKF